MIKVWISLLLVLLWFGSGAYAQEITKTYCASSVGYKGSIDTLKKELLVHAKNEAVGELFGELINSITKVEEGVLTEDKIRAISTGFLRIKGDPTYYQGENLGEICVKITAYAKDEDFESFKPRKLTHKACVMKGDVATIEKKAEEKAVLEALNNFNGKLKEYPIEQVLPFLHEITFSEGGFVPGTPVYCVRASGVIFPVEILGFTQKKSTNSNVKDKTHTLEKYSNEFSIDLNKYEIGDIPYSIGENLLIVLSNNKKKTISAQRTKIGKIFIKELSILNFELILKRDIGVRPTQLTDMFL